MSSSKLQRRVSEMLSIHLGSYTIRENHRPDWLASNNGGNLELDFYIKELATAIEVQGDQHFFYVPMFHGDESGFKEQIKRDELKRSLCEQRCIALYEVTNESESLELILKLAGKEHLYKAHPNAVVRSEKVNTKIQAKSLTELEPLVRSAFILRSQYKKEHPLSNLIAKHEKKLRKNLGRDFDDLDLELIIIQYRKSSQRGFFHD